MDFVDWNQRSLLISAASIAFNPIFWNIAARQEYHNQVISRLFNGNRRYGCYALAVTIFSLGIFRDLLFERALRDQPAHPILASPLVNIAAYCLLAIGNVFVLSSMWALGVTGTYLGDYFGILMDKKVTGFPFNVIGAPMYYGSTLSFLGSTLLFGKPTGLLLTAEVLVMYLLALLFEEYVHLFHIPTTTHQDVQSPPANDLRSPFTAEIYAKRDRDQAKGKGKKKSR